MSRKVFFDEKKRFIQKKNVKNNHRNFSIFEKLFLESNIFGFQNKILQISDLDFRRIIEFQIDFFQIWFDFPNLKNFISVKKIEIFWWLF